MLCFAVSQNPSCPVLCVVSEPGCCGSWMATTAFTARGTNPSLVQAAAPVSVWEALLLFSTPWKRSGERFVRVCVFCSRNNKGVSAVGKMVLVYSDGSAVGLPGCFAATSRGGGRAVADRAGGRGRRAAASPPVGITPGNSTRDSLPRAAIFPRAPAPPGVPRAPAR